jgi:tripartite-type tricarboxylate transporter receptor subunit TctC
VDKIAADTEQILALPEIAEALRGQGLEPTGLGPDAFARFLREDLIRWKTLIQEVGIKSDS